MSRLLHLKKNLDENQKASKTFNKKFVVVGHDLPSLIAFDRLSSEFNEQEILIINDREMEPQDILHSWETAALVGRGEAFKNYINEADGTSFFEEPNFYKDQTLKPFSGRAKPHKLLAYESFFIEKPYEIKFKNFFSDFEALCNEYQNCFYKPEVIKIEKNDHWELTCSDGSLVIAENLYWTNTREEFYEKASENLKAKFTENEKNFLLEHWNFSILNIYFYCSETINKNAQTIFIPQSFTYDHGHFIVDFSKPNESGEQAVRAYALIYDKSLSEEEVGKKIQHLKKSVEKVYPQFFATRPREEVRLMDGYLSSSREEANKINLEALPHLPTFFGTQAAVNLEQYPLEIPSMASVMKSIADLKIDSPVIN